MARLAFSWAACRAIQSRSLAVAFETSDTVPIKIAKKAAVNVFISTSNESILVCLLVGCFFAKIRQWQFVG
jgi:hypothetical protein